MHAEGEAVELYALETVNDNAGLAVINLLNHQKLLDVRTLVSLHLWKKR